MISNPPHLDKCTANTSLYGMKDISSLCLKFFRLLAWKPNLEEEKIYYCNHLVRPSVHTFVTDISASTGRNDFIFDIWLWHGDLSRVSPFQVYRTSTSCLQCDLEFFMFAVMETFVTVISASTGRNDFIFDIWLWHGDLYRVSPFQVYRTSTSCLPCDLQMNEWEYS